MIELVDGLGQLGTELAKNTFLNVDCIVYHKWNIDDLNNKDVQRKCYTDFVRFLDTADKPVCLISTLHEKDSMYLKYKLMAEAYLINSGLQYKIVKLPKIIGKGIFQKFKAGEEPWDNSMLEIISLQNAVTSVLQCLGNDKEINFIHGEFISKKMIYDLIRYGAKCSM